MNILITGSGGFIGSNLVNELKKHHFIFELYNGSEYCIKGNQIICNILNKKHIEKLLNENIEVDVIIHTASILASKDNINNLSLFYDNIKMYENLISIIDKFNPSRVINFSSIAVYPNKDGNFSEISEIKPSENAECLYGLSKFCGENILDFFVKEKNIIMIHLRVSQVYGVGMREDRIMKVMEKELKDKNMITVFGKGERISNFIDIETLIYKIKLLLNYGYSNIFNIGKENLSYKELAEKIIIEYGNKDSKIVLLNKGVFSKTKIDCTKEREFLK